MNLARNARKCSCFMLAPANLNMVASEHKQDVDAGCLVFSLCPGILKVCTREDQGNVMHFLEACLCAQVQTGDAHWHCKKGCFALEPCSIIRFLMGSTGVLSYEHAAQPCNMPAELAVPHDPLHEVSEE